MDLLGFTFLAVIAALLVGLFAAHRAGSRGLDRAWQEAAQTLGLTFEPERLTGRRHVAGWLDGCRVSMAVRHGRKSDDLCTLVEVESSDVPAQLVVDYDRPLLFDRDGLTTGDPQFDRTFRVDGKEASALAAVGPDARRHLSALVDYDARVSARTLSVEFEGAGLKGHELVAILRRCVAAVRALGVPPKGVSIRLAENLANERLPQIRLRLLRALAAHCKGSPGLERALQHSLEDEDPELRLEAAVLAGGPAGRACLEGLLAGSEDAVEAKALAALEALGSEDASLRAFILEALRSGGPLLQREALRLAVERPDPAQLEEVLPLAQSPDDGVREGAARALGALGQPRAEETLIRLLADPVAAVQRESASALEGIGTLAAVAPLLPLAQTITSRDGVREAAREAARAIQARHAVVGSGGLSLVDEPASSGALSLPTPGRSRTGD